MRLPDIVFPKIAARIGHVLPDFPPRLALVLALNNLLKKGILPADMSLLSGRHFEIRVLDMGLIIRITADEEKFRVDHTTDKTDLLFAANAVDFAKILLREEDPDTLFFNQKLQIEGDTELGLIVKNLLDSVDWSNTALARFVSG